ncbi:YbaB/EbfC family nucleoid-associated protein [Glycomyces paridis]|uniref:YbaB/EbfC family nucleoid-associated protein n=1 Tax=Glycomyces paridis TaxID=2126555 RepID=A0A4S8PP32_9ACTN|nr:YbaB/EbfC family nucleoid-associated protein [Glycomyces paridis]THV30094.1 YbaB/EbfC family nucleoid-associated protein [Glycomyces paridis]
MSEDSAEEMRGKAKAIERIAVELRAEAISEGGAVRVVAGAADSIWELDLRLNAFELSGVELGELIVETIKDANRKAGAEMAEQAGQIMGREISPESFDGTPERIEREEEQR